MPFQVEHPCLLTHLPQFFELAKGKRVTVFMDYDGEAHFFSDSKLRLDGYHLNFSRFIQGL